MCELFGVSARRKISSSGYLNEFFSHGKDHPNGWGIALFYDGSVSLEKEPVRADKSRYLKERLRGMSETSDCIAHIRLATRGADEYENTHPFVKRDGYGRAWTFAHNGTVFNGALLDEYFHRQEGRTDSERILCYLIDRVNGAQKTLGRALNFPERFTLLEGITEELSIGNKLNFLLYDGEILYVHSNYARSLYCLQKEGAAIFSTAPLSDEDWRPVAFTALLAYSLGTLIKTGRVHGNEYRDNDKDTELLFLDYSSL